MASGARARASERASREDSRLRGHIKRSHLYTPRSMGRMDNICQLQTFLFPVLGREGRGGEGAREGEGRADQARVRLKDSALPAAATRKPGAMKARGFFSDYHY